MTTNGLLLTREKIERLISRRLSALCVSADASEEKTYQAVRPGGDFSRLLNVLDQLIASRQEAKCPEPLIFATFLLRRRALSELAPFARLMAERGLDGVIFQHLTGVFSKAGCEEIAYSSYYGNPFPEAELTEALAAARAAVPRGFTLVGPERIAPRRTGNCGGFDLSRAFITASGQVSVCCAMASPCAFIRRDGNLERTRAFTFGDAREKPLPEIWASKSYAQTRAAIRSGKVPPACGDCIGLYMTAGEVCRKE
jgi:MoaA/NifB/PqqE/SkfB family radical SAM enzyme